VKSGNSIHHFRPLDLLADPRKSKLHRQLGDAPRWGSGTNGLLLESTARRGMAP
jgi:hypothetical protein